MSSTTAISPEKLSRLVGTPKCPTLIDVRTDADFGADPRLIPSARRRNADQFTDWIGKVHGPAVVYCQQGHRLSEGVAALLRAHGIAAEILEGGFEAWRDAGQPLVPTDNGPKQNIEGRTVWVTRARPKIDRIACPWLIRRFVDPDAIILFVTPAEVAAVAERFGGAPFDIDGVFWSHRGDLCTFDIMIEEFGLATEPLLRLATIVRGADTARPDLAPEAPGLLAASLGLSRMYADDLEQLDAGMLLYDAFYRWCRDATGETHNWPHTKSGEPVMDQITKTDPAAAGSPGHDIPFGEAVRVWARIAALSFGGPAGQIAVMHRILVEEKRWIGEHRFLHALNYCMLLPGPEAQQLAIYVGWLLHRTMGGLVAGVLFILPGFLSILALSFVYVIYGEVDVVEGLFFGLKAAVLAVVLQAVLRIGGRVLKNPAMIAVAIAAFLAIFAFNVPFPLIIFAAGLVGFIGGRSGSSWYRLGGGHGSGKDSTVPDADTALGDRLPDHAQPNIGWSLRISGILLALWLVPVAALVLVLGRDDVFSQIAVFFSQMAVVTFGGAYAVLGYVAQEAVQNLGWLEPGEMLDGLGMAETTPGPLIMVVQFVGFLAAYREAGGLHPLAAASFGAILTTWVTFVPCFLWIFLGAPFIERLRDNVALTGAMTAITAAVVGVIMNLAIWFSIHALFGEVKTWRGLRTEIEVPLFQTLDWTALALTAAAVIAVFGFKVGMIKVLLACALVGAALHV